jgi:hypothetical protein
MAAAVAVVLVEDAADGAESGQWPTGRPICLSTLSGIGVLRHA